MINSIQKSAYLLCAVLLLNISPLSSQTRLLTILSDELDREFEYLQKQDLPPYYLEYRVSDRQTVSIAGSFGSLISSDKNRTRKLYSSIRVGNNTFDNTHPSENEFGRDGGQWMENTNIPLEDDAVAIRQRIWRITDVNYKSAVSSYQNLESKRKKSDTIPDFSLEQAHQHFDPPLKNQWSEADQNLWESRVKEYSGIFLRDKVILDGDASLEYIRERKYFVSSEGSRIEQNHQRISLVLSASILAEDGNIIPLVKVFNAPMPEDLPSPDSVVQSCQELIKNLRLLALAPMADPYSGPAILSSAASGVFFHEIFGHRIEGHRLKSKSDGQTFKTQIGEPILNKTLSVLSDPTVDNYNGQYLAGYYAYDEQGVPGQKVSVVERGILKEFLMSRQALTADSKSNGHGRADAGIGPVSRQSNLFIKSENPKSEEHLRKMLKQQCRKLGLEYGYYIDEVSGGFTSTDRYRPNVFNIEPRMVYRVYVDGRPDELVRGVTLIGTPLVMFSGIEAAGDQPGIFTGICGAESGGVPVSTVSPSLLISRIETQKIPEGNFTGSILPIPGGIKSSHQTPASENIILKAMEDEMNHNMKNLKYKDYESPFFISYSFSKHQVYSASATLGSIQQSGLTSFGTNNVRLMVGSYELNDENFADYSAPDNFSRGYISTPMDQDYWGIRRSFWKMTDQVYKSAGSLYKKKVNALKTMELPAGFEPIPDFSREKTIELDLHREKARLDTTGMDDMLRDYSALMRDYPELIASEVSLVIYQNDHYFINTEGSRNRYPQDYCTLSFQVESLSENSQNLFFILTYTATQPALLPSDDSIKKEVRSTIDSLLLVGKAPAINEAYHGPVLFLGEAASTTLSSLLVEATNKFTASRPGLIKDNQQNLYYNSMSNGEHASPGQRVMARNTRLTSLSHMTHFEQTPLIGNYPVDAEGLVPSSELLLVDNGVLVKQMNGRTPTLEVQQSTGHMRSSPFSGKHLAPGILNLEVTEGSMSDTSLKQKLLSLARDENLDYAYIVRRTMGGGIPFPLCLYQVDLETGKESLVRVMSLLDLPENSLRKISDFSDERVANNLNIQGLFISLIIPDGFIVEDVKLNPMFSPISIPAPILPNLLETNQPRVKH